MKVVTIRAAKRKFSVLIQEVATGEEIIIAEKGKPLARLSAVGVVKSKRRPGSLKGKIRVGRKFFQPLPPSELEGWN